MKFYSKLMCRKAGAINANIVLMPVAGNKSRLLFRVSQQYRLLWFVCRAHFCLFKYLQDVDLQ